MDYVMVPVPEEHAEEVLSFLHWNVAAPAVKLEWDPRSIARIFRAADDPTRALLVAVAQAQLEDRDVTIAEVAAKINCSQRETVGITLELTYQYRVEGAPLFLVLLKTVLPKDESGGMWPDKAIAMADDVASLVLEAHAAEGDGA